MPIAGFSDARLGRDLDATVLVEAGGEATRFFVRNGVVVASEPQGVMARYDIALRFTAEGWQKFRADPPPPRWGDLMALRRHGAVAIEGDTRLFFAYLPWFKAAFARPSRAPSALPAWTPGYDAVTGRYFHMELEGRPHRVFVEEAGTGIPLLLLHTAGSDARQWRHLLNDPEVTSRFRCIAPDMPWHGKSSPPPGWEREEYRLTTAGYTGFALALCAALGAERPVVMGCSIGGRIVLDLAARHADALRGVIGLQGSAFVHPYYDTTMLYHPQVHGEVCAAAVSGLIAPTAPEADRHETLWHYMQGGPGIFRGDLHFYKEEGDLRPLLARIDTGKCPVHLLTGEHDYSCRPEDTLATAAAIPGAVAKIMEGLGHFPMSEDYGALRPHLLPVLEDFAARG